MISFKEFLLIEDQNKIHDFDSQLKRNGNLKKVWHYVRPSKMKGFSSKLSPNRIMGRYENGKIETIVSNPTKPEKTIKYLKTKYKID